jgi:hypothetical protein
MELLISASPGLTHLVELTEWMQGWFSWPSAAADVAVAMAIAKAFAVSNTLSTKRMMRILSFWGSL